MERAKGSNPRPSRWQRDALPLSYARNKNIIFSCFFNSSNIKYVIDINYEKRRITKIIPVFPLSNFIIFPKTTVPLNIFEPRYIDMINDSMRNNKLIGMIQPKKNKNEKVDKPILHEIGCLGKITSFKELMMEDILLILRD